MHNEYYNRIGCAVPELTFCATTTITKTNLLLIHRIKKQIHIECAQHIAAMFRPTEKWIYQQQPCVNLISPALTSTHAYVRVSTGDPVDPCCWPLLFSHALLLRAATVTHAVNLHLDHTQLCTHQWWFTRDPASPMTARRVGWGLLPGILSCKRWENSVLTIF